MTTFQNPSMAAEQTDLRSLIGHREAIEAETSLESVYERFCQHPHEFMAVLDGSRFLGLCSRREIAMKLGHRFGNALYARGKVRDHLATACLAISVGDGVPNVLRQISTRADDTFYDDVALLSDDGSFEGLIFVKTLVRLQSRLLHEKIGQLETHEAELNAWNEKIREDLNLANELQQAMLPQQYPFIASKTNAGSRAVRFLHHYHSAGAVGGDFFHLMALPGGKAGLLLCDVMGHEVRSALVAAMMRALVEALKPAASDPGPFLTLINQDLIRMLRNSQAPMFVTAFYAVLNPAAGLLYYAKAGHHDALLLRRQAGTVTPLAGPADAAGPALGLFEQAKYSTGVHSMKRHDLLLMFTDGLFETYNTRQEEFGFDRLVDTLQRHLRKPSAVLVNETMKDIQTFRGPGEACDDVCLVGAELMEPTLPANGEPLHVQRGGSLLGL